MTKKFFLKTFGCQQNVADSERIESFYLSRGFSRAETIEEADVLLLNTCVIRDKAEEKVYGMIKSLRTRLGNKSPHIVVTGCLIGAASRVPGGKMMKRLTTRLPDVEFLPLEEVGFEYTPTRASGKTASIVISNGCNNYCAFCIVPFSRGKERSRAFADILSEAKQVIADGYEEIVLLGQNVNSYGADFLQEKIQEEEEYILPDGKKVKPVMVKHLNRHRIPTLFPYLLESVAQIPKVKKVTFISSNPWDFSDELINVMARYENINRELHLPVQSGNDEILKKMNRWYTREEYLSLIDRIRQAIPKMTFTTDIIVGFPGETREQFEDSIDIVKRVGFVKTFIAWYSPRPGTSATKGMEDDVRIEEKQRRFHELDAIAFKGKK
ncbi:MAG: MiaB/RimO family radical SAM methylthiotransferase [Candidatus Moranbacteria bacterium]|nr:MiaB/RimO family radical SAM methylthiotransferase [Candidatus Moranbacteria bacterium]MDD3964784.1 MiaB/RimO family radical SAM methylthiotransferase [Candidatus Moranbacteria bacterium]